MLLPCTIASLTWFSNMSTVNFDPNAHEKGFNVSLLCLNAVPYVILFRNRSSSRKLYRNKTIWSVWSLDRSNVILQSVVFQSNVGVGDEGFFFFTVLLGRNGAGKTNLFSGESLLPIILACICWYSNSFYKPPILKIMIAFDKVSYSYCFVYQLSSLCCAKSFIILLLGRGRIFCIPPLASVALQLMLKLFLMRIDNSLWVKNTMHKVSHVFINIIPNFSCYRGRKWNEVEMGGDLKNRYILP